MDAFAKGDILQVLLIAILFGFSLAAMGDKGKPVFDFVEQVPRAVRHRQHRDEARSRWAPSVRWPSPSASTASASLVPMAS